MDRLNELGQKLNEAVYQFQEFLKSAPPESEWTGEFKEKHAKFEADIDKRLADVENCRDMQAAAEKRARRLDEVKSFLREPITSPVIESNTKTSGKSLPVEQFREYQRKAFYEVLRDGFRDIQGTTERFAKEHNVQGIQLLDIYKDEERVRSAEKHALVIRDASLGGAMVPAIAYKEIVSNAAALYGLTGIVRHVPTSGPYLPMARIQPATGNNLSIYPSGFAGKFKGEADVTVISNATAQNQPLTGDIRIQVHKWKPDPIFISSDLIADAPAFESEIDRILLETFGLDKDNQILNGVGQDAPLGILTGTGNLAITGVNSGVSGAFTWEGLMDLLGQTPGQYAASPSAAFVSRRESYFSLYKVQDNAGRFVLTPNQPLMTLMGYKVVTSQFLPAIAGAAKAAIFGDWSRYVVADRMEMQIGRIDQVAWPDLYIQPVARYGGQVTVPDAFRVQVLSA